MKLTVKTIILCGVNVVLLVLFGVCCALYSSAAGTLQAQAVAERWRGGNETPYAQVSLYRDSSDAMMYRDVYMFRQGIEDALVAASLDPEANEMIFTDAFCVVDKINVSSAKTKNVETTLYAVGGDFFTFHPLKLSSGTYIAERDLNRDLVVIDRELSWTLFGSVDTVGLTLTVGGNEYIVAGVVERDDDFFSAKVSQPVSAIYMPFAAVYDYETAVITSYEAVMPNPVDNFAMDTMKNLSTSGEFVENSERFKLANISDLIFSFGKRAISTSGVSCPTWESAARLCEDYLALIAALAAVFVLLPAVFTVILIVRGYLALKKTGKRVANRIREKY